MKFVVCTCGYKTPAPREGPSMMVNAPKVTSVLCRKCGKVVRL